MPRRGANTSRKELYERRIRTFHEPIRGAAGPFTSQLAAAERLLPSETEYDLEANPTPFMRPKEGYNPTVT